MPNATPARSLLLCGLVMLVLLLQAAAGSFALWRNQAEQGASRQALAQLTTRLDSARLAEVAFKVQVQEWKNILLRGNDPALRARHEAAFRAEQHRVDEALAGLDAGPLRQAHGAVNAAYEAALASARLETGEGARAADAAVRGIDRAFQAQLEEAATWLLREYQSGLRAAEDAAAARYGQLSLLLNIMAGGGLLLTLLLLFLVTRR